MIRSMSTCSEECAHDQEQLGAHVQESVHMISNMWTRLEQVQLSLALSHAENACVYVHTYIELVRGMYGILGTGDILVRMLRSWGKMKVNQHRSTRMSATVGTSSTLYCTLTCTRREPMRICSHAYRTIQMYV